MSNFDEFLAIDFRPSIELRKQINENAISLRAYKS